MIKTYTLQFASQEIEEIYRQSLLTGIKHRREYTYGILSLYLGLIIIKYNLQEVLLPQIFAGVGIALELALFFFMKKYWQNKEILITMNLILMATICECLRLFESQDFLWYQGQHSSCLKLIIYLQGSQFLIQSFIFCCSQAVAIYNLSQYDISAIISHCLITLILVMLRYQYEIINRKNFLSGLSKEQYENVIEDLLPSWVVVLKYNKLASQLQIEKINKNLKEKFNLQSNEALRDFLRKLTLYDFEVAAQSSTIKIEHEIIQILKSKSEDHPVQRYFGNLEKEVNSKQHKFKITQVYFKAFEPQVILLFEEIKEDKYDQFLNQIEQRDIQQHHNSKVSLLSIYQQMQLIQQVHTQTQMSTFIKKDQSCAIQQNLQKLMQQCYYLYNLNNNLSNLYKISHRQIKYEFQDLQTEQFFKTTCDNLLINYQQRRIDITNFSIKKEIIRTDKNKLVSIIMNLMEFMKILLSIIYTDESIIFQIHPFKKPFSLSIKQSKLQNDSILITLTHPNLNIPNSIINLIQNIQTISIDDKKRNWNNKNYYDMISSLNHTLSKMIDHYKNDIQSLATIGVELQNSGQQNRTHQHTQQKQFNTLGFIMAQYFISQLGPFNKINFKQALIENDILNPQYISALYQTKIQFTIYKDLQNFSREISKLEGNNLDENLFFSQKKYNNQQITDRLFQINFEDQQKNIF
ncbi:unnamed protein product (macronuclear) [Paramecium tetraurelia]|uniref:Transmembrane protein n=1 Tax=Paramecium tetraurelia TaxID=5888 RepID=A0BVE8_PARTE|nr:uncharacterized protein GSPATT00005761001 [Paramecium tetraurelia]CAK62515.1 unnamed protein product [Paramecium tetraurelia]|eukprot:XP_001429913.1 hypothetical protein (macronuclear) [Paramecium tetraurelia strain d4-2]